MDFSLFWGCQEADMEFSLFWGCLEADMDFSLFLGRLEADTTNLHMHKFSRLIWIWSYPKVLALLKNDCFIDNNLIFRVLLSYTVFVGGADLKANAPQSNLPFLNFKPFTCLY